jgi:hypothetical protein
MEAIEKRLEAALETLKTVRPAFEAFYGSLNEKQKASLDVLGPHRRGWRW